MSKEYNDRQDKPLREQYRLEQMVLDLSDALDKAKQYWDERGDAA
jgi:hypothetical protein